ncbi:MAG: IS1182-like element ISMac1 family transposase [Halioglobus sp.]
MPNFKPYDYNQTAMVVVNFEEQLQPGTFEFTLHHLVDNHIDLSAFYDKYRNEGGGRAAYDPAILLKIILFAYSKGITSSREIQWQCEHNIIYKALSCDTVPHFTGIASFISSYPDAIESVFEQVLMVCDEQGLLGNELFAIDGCKMPSNAAKEHSGTLDELQAKRKKIQKRIRHCLKEHKKLDGRKPRERERRRRLEQFADTLEKHFKRIDDFLKTASPRTGEGKQRKEVKSNITDNESAKMTTSKGTIQGYNGIAAVDQKHQIIVEAQAFGASQEQHTLKPMLAGIESRYLSLGCEDIYATGAVVTADTGFATEQNNQHLKAEGINAYIPDNQFRSRDPRFRQQKDKYGKRHQANAKGIKKVIPAGEFTFDLKEKRCECPAGKPMWLMSDTKVQEGRRKLTFEGKLTDCRSCPKKGACMRNPDSANTREGHGRQVSITYKTGKTATDWMKRRVDSAEGKAIYGQRMAVVEPVFGNIGTNKKLNRFSLRGKDKVQGQWRLFCLVHNIEKVMRYGALS